MPEQDPRKVTVEDLLRLKRAERPDEAFWGNFDRQMRQKQLAALVKEKAWWEVLPSTMLRYVIHPIPIGASAALVMGVVGLRSFVAPQLTVQDPLESLSPVSGADVAATVGMQVASPQIGEPAVDASPVAPRIETVADDTHTLVSLVPWVTSTESLESDPLSPTETKLLPALSYPRRDFQPAIPTAQQAIVLPAVMVDDSDPVQATEPESLSAREKRLMALRESAGYGPEAAPSEQTRYRLSRYLSDDGFERSMNRLAAQGDRLSVRF